jgi:protein phosphatase 1 regulatory subunit 37
MADIESQLERAPASKPSSGKLLVEADANLAARAADLSGALAKLIQKASSSSSSSMNPERLVELLSLNDELTELIASRFVPKPKPKPEALRVKNGLGLDLSHIGSGINGGGAVPSYFIPNGTEDSGLLTPRGSRKGKERAEPEPEPFEKVTTPTFVLESDNEDDESAHGLAGGRMVDEPEEGEDGADAGETSPSQNERSRYWVEEEGEVFRKGQKLLGVEEMEGDFAGEELRQEVRAPMSCDRAQR